MAQDNTEFIYASQSHQRKDAMHVLPIQLLKTTESRAWKSLQSQLECSMPLCTLTEAQP